MGPLPLPQIIQGRNFTCSVLPFLAWIESFRMVLKSLNLPAHNFNFCGVMWGGHSQFKWYIVVVGNGIAGLSKTQLCNFAILQNTLGRNLSHFATSWVHLLTKVTDSVAEILHLTYFVVFFFSSVMLPSLFVVRISKTYLVNAFQEKIIFLSTLICLQRQFGFSNLSLDTSQ